MIVQVEAEVVLNRPSIECVARLVLWSPDAPLYLEEFPSVEEGWHNFHDSLAVVDARDWMRLEFEQERGKAPVVLGLFEDGKPIDFPDRFEAAQEYERRANTS